MPSSDLTGIGSPNPPELTLHLLQASAWAQPSTAAHTQGSGQAFADFRFAFFNPTKTASFKAGLALNRTVAPAFTGTFSPVRGFSAVRFGVSRTLKAPSSGIVKRPTSMISALIAAIMSAASVPAALAGISVDLRITSVRNFFDMAQLLAKGEPVDERSE